MACQKTFKTGSATLDSHWKQPLPGHYVQSPACCCTDPLACKSVLVLKRASGPVAVQKASGMAMLHQKMMCIADGEPNGTVSVHLPL